MLNDVKLYVLMSKCSSMTSMRIPFASYIHIFLSDLTSMTIIGSHMFLYLTSHYQKITAALAKPSVEYSFDSKGLQSNKLAYTIFNSTIKTSELYKRVKRTPKPILDFRSYWNWNKAFLLEQWKYARNPDNDVSQRAGLLREILLIRSLLHYLAKG